MKNVYKWRIVTNKYLYITDEENNGPFIFNKVTKERIYSNGIPHVDDYGVDEGKISQIVSQIRDASTYETMFNDMVTLAMTDEDASKLHFLDYTNYFNLDSEECVQEAITPKCEGYEPVFEVSAYTIDETGVTYTFFPERNEQDKTLRYKLDLGIPRGEKGEPGEDGTGCKGDKGDDGKSAVITSADATAYALPSGVTIPTAEVVVVPESIGSETENDYAFHFTFGLPQGPKGEKGDNGATGYDGKDSIISNARASVEALQYGQEPRVTVTTQTSSTSSENQTEMAFQFELPSGPQGEVGPQGEPAYIGEAYVSNVHTLEPGEQARATCESIYVSGNTYNLNFEFWIPRGEDGTSGGGGGYIYNIDDPTFVKDDGITEPYGLFNTVYHPAEGNADVTLTIHYPASWGGESPTDIKHRYNPEVDSLSEGVLPIEVDNVVLPYAVASGIRSHAEGIGTSDSTRTITCDADIEKGGGVTITTTSPEHSFPGEFNNAEFEVNSTTYYLNASNKLNPGDTGHTTFVYSTYSILDDSAQTIYVSNNGATIGIWPFPGNNHLLTTIEVSFPQAEPNASGIATHTEGNSCQASGDYSHAEGNSTVALGDDSHAEGYNTTASGDYSHSEGEITTSSGEGSHAEGGVTTASKSFSHAEGYHTTASNYCSHTEGFMTTASGEISHAEGSRTTASNSFSHAEGQSTRASGNTSHAEGYNTTASGGYSHAEGDGTMASGSYSHAEGRATTASNTCSHAEGSGTTASGSWSHAEGYNTTASGTYSHAEGYNTTASGISHAEGDSTTASGTFSHAEGRSTTASGETSHAEGYLTVASGEISHAEGDGSTASGIYSHAEGYRTTANGKASHASGEGTVAYNDNMTVVGQYNDEYSNKDLFVVGNGDGPTHKSTAMAVQNDNKVILNTNNGGIRQGVSGGSETTVWNTKGGISTLSGGTGIELSAVTTGDTTVITFNNTSVDSHREIQVNSTQALGNNSTPLNLVQGSGITISADTAGTVTITNSAIDNDTWRNIKIDDVDFLTDKSQPLNLTGGTNITLTTGSSGTVGISADDTWRNIKINGNDFLIDDKTSPLNLKAEDNITLTTGSSGTVGIKADNTWRNIKVKGVDFLTDKTYALDFSGGTGIELTTGNSGTVGIECTITDTKDTAGATNNNSKLYLVGATAQTAYTQTYTNTNVYTQNGNLYANNITAEDVTITGSGGGGGGGISVRYMMPTGSIVMWPTTNPPTGWLLCDGTNIAVTSGTADDYDFVYTGVTSGEYYKATKALYRPLLSIIGATYGTVIETVETTTYLREVSLPNFKLKFPLGASTDSYIGHSNTIHLKLHKVKLLDNIICSVQVIGSGASISINDVIDLTMSSHKIPLRAPDYCIVKDCAISNTSPLIYSAITVNKCDKYGNITDVTDDSIFDYFLNPTTIVTTDLYSRSKYSATIGQTGGADDNTLTVSEMPSHSHTLHYGSCNGAVPTAEGYFMGNTGFGNTSSKNSDGSEGVPYIENTGGSLPHNNIPPYLAINYIIKYM